MGYTLDPAEVPPYATEKAWRRFCDMTVVTADHVIWTGAISKAYGTFTDSGFRNLDLELADHKATVTATRWLLTAYFGPIGRGMRAMHACDLPICVDLEDLSLGSQQQNIRDAADRDRLARRQGRTRLDRADVRGADAQSRAIRFAVLEAIDNGITDPEALDWVVAAVVAEGDPAALSAQVPLFPLADLPGIGPARRRHRRCADPASSGADSLPSSPAAPRGEPRGLSSTGVRR